MWGDGGVYAYVLAELIDCLLRRQPFACAGLQQQINRLDLPTPRAETASFPSCMGGYADSIEEATHTSLYVLKVTNDTSNIDPFSTHAQIKWWLFCLCVHTSFSLFAQHGGGRQKVERATTQAI